MCSTYESASTRRFRKGRVDNIRANSCEALEWVQSMDPESNSSVSILTIIYNIILLTSFGIQYYDVVEILGTSMSKFLFDYNKK